MPATPLILSIDDDPNNQALMQKTFADDRLHVAYSGEEGLGLAARLNPDVILLDISMPGMNGIEVCRILKANPQTQPIPVLFISAMNSLEDRLAGYKAGGEDFICKPVDLKELKYKIDVLMHYRASLTQMDERLKSASEVAYTALSNSGELGVVVNFVESSFACGDFAGLSDALLDALEQYQVTGCVAIHPEQGASQLFSSTLMTPLETQLLELSRNGKRIVTVGRRVIFNAPHISVLIKDMPADEERAGRLRDHLARLMTIAEARINALMLEQRAAQSRSSSVQDALANAEKSLHEIDLRIRRMQGITEDVLGDLTTRLEQRFVSLMLSDEQEEAILAPLHEARTRLENVFDENSQIDTCLEALKRDLTKALRQ